jgi:methyl-accepting chemotaxis protein
MIMLKSARNAGLKQKLLFSNTLYVVLLGAITFFFVSSGTLIGNLSKKQKDSDAAVNLMQKAAVDIQDYVNKRLSDSELENRYQKLLPELKALNLAADLEKIWVKVEQIRRLRGENAGIAKQLNELADVAIEQSNQYIREMVPKLANESTRANVSELETLVIGNANINTSSNYQLKVLFSRLAIDLSEKQELQTMFSNILENVEKALKTLAGTPFEVLPAKAKESVIKMRELTANFVKNVEQAESVQKGIFEEMDARLKQIANVKNETNIELFGQLRSYFRNMLIIILAISLIGILTSLLTIRSVSKALNKIIQGLSEASEGVNSAASQLSISSQSMAEGASEQAASIEETSSSLEQMASMTKQNADNASQANKLMSQTTQVVSGANESMKHLTSSMQEISRASEETSKIIKTIDEIAFQTNLLALNAAVEAARAGEAGAGFAVVADEVRNLAVRAAEAAKNTATLIEGTVKKINEGSTVVQKTSSEFSLAADSVSKMGELVGEITAASDEQAKGIDQINRAVSEMDKVVQQNAANAEESSSVSQETSAQAENMNEFIEQLIAVISGGGGSASAVNVSGIRRARELPTGARGFAFDRGSDKKAGTNGQGAHKLMPGALSARNTKAEAMIPFDEEGRADF